MSMVLPEEKVIELLALAELFDRVRFWLKERKLPEGYEFDFNINDIAFERIDKYTVLKKINDILTFLGIPCSIEKLENTLENMKDHIREHWESVLTWLEPDTENEEALRERIVAIAGITLERACPPVYGDITWIKDALEEVNSAIASLEKEISNKGLWGAIGVHLLYNAIPQILHSLNLIYISYFEPKFVWYPPEALQQIINYVFSNISHEEMYGIPLLRILSLNLIIPYDNEFPSYFIYDPSNYKLTVYASYQRVLLRDAPVMVIENMYGKPLEIFITRLYFLSQLPWSEREDENPLALYLAFDILLQFYTKENPPSKEDFANILRNVTGLDIEKLNDDYALFMSILEYLAGHNSYDEYLIWLLEENRKDFKEMIITSRTFEEFLEKLKRIRKLNLLDDIAYLILVAKDRLRELYERWKASSKELVFEIIEEIIEGYETDFKIGSISLKGVIDSSHVILATYFPTPRKDIIDEALKFFEIAEIMTLYSFIRKAKKEGGRHGYYLYESDKVGKIAFTVEYISKARKLYNVLKRSGLVSGKLYIGIQKDKPAVLFTDDYKLLILIAPRIID